MSRAKKAPEKEKKEPYEDVQMRALHRLVQQANRLQSTREYSLCDQRGETYFLSYWSGYRQHETVIVPAGTPQTQAKLQWGIDEMRRQIEELKRSFGRYLRDEG